MRILHVAPSIERSYGGPSQSLAGFIAASAQSGDESVVAAPHSSPDAVARLEQAGAASVEGFPVFGNAAFIVSPALVRWMHRNASGFDVVHVHGLFNPVSTFAARAAVRLDAPLLMRPFGTLSRYTVAHRRSALKRGYFAALERHNINGAAGIHFTTAAEKQDAAWRTLNLADRAHVVPPPFIDTPPARASSSKSGAEVLFLGRLNPVKNIESLLDAWPSVVAKVSHARLTIAGSGADAYVERLRSRAASLGIMSSVSFTGFVDGRDKAELLGRAAVFCLPSYHENFGVVVLEAISAGMPVVVSREVQLCDFVAQRHLGVVTDTSPALLANALVQSLQDRELRDRVGARGNQIVNEAYGVESLKPKLSSMYESVIKYHRNRGNAQSKNQ